MHLIYHFDAEERLHVRFDYPKSEEHYKEHKDFIIFFDQLNVDDIMAYDTEMLIDLWSKIADIMYEHIKTSDFLFDQHLKNVAGKAS